MSGKLPRFRTIRLPQPPRMRLLLIFLMCGAPFFPLPSTPVPSLLVPQAALANTPPLSGQDSARKDSVIGTSTDSIFLGRDGETGDRILRSTPSHDTSTPSGNGTQQEINIEVYPRVYPPYMPGGWGKDRPEKSRPSNRPNKSGNPNVPTRPLPQ